VTDEENKIIKKTEMDNANSARVALDNGKPRDAYRLIEKATFFWPQNLITLITIIAFNRDDRPLANKALAQFYRQLGLCSNSKSLPQVANWLRNPKRERIIPFKIRKAVDEHRKCLEPEWDGVWSDDGIGPSNKSLSILKSRPEDVSDANDCLIAASQTQNWQPWIARYQALGGSPDNVTYIKLVVSKAVSVTNEPTWWIKGLLEKFTLLGTVHEVRSFLRKITPVRPGVDGKTPNPELAVHALQLYINCARLNNTMDDWVHIAESAVYHNHRNLMKVMQRLLANGERNQAADDVYQRLIHRSDDRDP